eukprot:Skav232589  [mRNA]  locus=scaffold2040:19369:31459:- [translate_table: standard]
MTVSTGKADSEHRGEQIGIKLRPNMVVFRSWVGGHAMILWEEPHFGFSSQRRHFEDARRKSGATFGIRGVEDPVFLRWVHREDFPNLQRAYDREAAFFVSFTTLLLAAGLSSLTLAFRLGRLLLVDTKPFYLSSFVRFPARELKMRSGH